MSVFFVGTYNLYQINLNITLNVVVESVSNLAKKVSAAIVWGAIGATAVQSAIFTNAVLHKQVDPTQSIHVFLNSFWIASMVGGLTGVAGRAAKSALGTFAAMFGAPIYSAIVASAVAGAVYPFLMREAAAVAAFGACAGVLLTKP